MNPENMQQRAPMDSIEADKFDAKGKPRSPREMKDGTIFYGSDEEYADEMSTRNEEAK